MATSTPDPAEVTPVPWHERLETVAAQINAIDKMIDLARHSIRVFDVDLAETGWNAAVRTAKIAALLRAHPAARLQIVVHDTGWIERSSPRLTRLLRYHSDAIAIYRSGAGAKHAMDPLVIVDDRHYLHRFHAAQPRAAFAVDDPEGAQPLVIRFEEIWASAEPGVGATVLGL